MKKIHCVASLTLFLIAVLISACAGKPDTAVPIPLTATPERPTPAASLFTSLPLHAPGEVVQQGEYTIALDNVQLDAANGQLSLSLTITNSSAAVVDLGWAVQLRDPQGGYVTPLRTDAPLPANLEAKQSLAAGWVYPLAQSADGEALLEMAAYREYRLVFAPRGWSGPITIFRLTK